MLTGKAYHKALPAKRMAAGVVIRNDVGYILIVEPTYKSEWELPGGVVEALESPLAAAVREVKEELGVQLDRSRLVFLSVDYLHETEERTEALMFLFGYDFYNSSPFEDSDIDGSEIKRAEFVPLAVAVDKLGPIVGPRAARAYEALITGRGAYWEDGGHQVML